MPLWTKTKPVGDLHQFVRRHWQRLLRIRETLRLSEEAIHLFLAAGVGIIGGLVNLGFHYATELVGMLFMRNPGSPEEVASHMARWQRVLTPTLGGLCAGLALYWGLRLAGPQRSTNLLEVVVAGDGRLPFRNGLVKFLSSLLSIGSGGSIGREGAITQLSATFASKWGQLARWHPYRLRLLVGCGAASGIAAAYNAPVSGAVFAGLIVLGNFSMGMFAPLVCASVVAAMVSRSFFGLRPLYDVPTAYEFSSLIQLPWFLILGIVVGGMGALFLKLLNRAEELFKKMNAPIFARLALGGLIVGLISMAFPEVWGNGSHSITTILQWDLTHQIRPASPSGAASEKSAATGAVASPAPSASGSDAASSLDPNLALAMTSSNLLAKTTNAPAGRQETPLTSGGEAQILQRHILDTLQLLACILLAKLLATLATVGSGAVGGVFTPTLFLGAALGGLLGLGLHALHIAEELPLAVFALVGMGGMLSATTRSPLLAMIMIVEISHDYSVLPPLMLACVVSVLVARRLHPESIYTEPLRRKGLTVSHDATTSEAATERTVSDLLRAPVPPVRETATLGEIAQRFMTSTNNFLPVVDSKGSLVGLVALQDLKEFLGSGEEVLGVIAYDFMRPPPRSVTPNQRLLEVLPVVLASEQRNIPVVNSLKENKLVGALARAEVLGIFSEVIAASKRAGA